MQGFQFNSEGMHRATHEDAYTRAWFDFCRSVFPQSVRKAGPNVDLHKVSTYQCSIIFNHMGSFDRKSELRKAENMNKPISPNEKFNVTNDPQLSLLTEFWRNNCAHVILTAEADSIPTDEKELLDDYGLVGCHSSRSNDLSVRARIDSSRYLRLFYGKQMMTEMDMQHFLRSSLAIRQKEQLQNRASDRLSSSLTLQSLLR